MEAISIDTIGIDEVGRGAWAGPLVVAAVLFPSVPRIPDGVIIRDSKSLSPFQREKAAQFISENAICTIVSAPHSMIDLIGIQEANKKLFVSAARKILNTICTRYPSSVGNSFKIQADGRPICIFPVSHKFIIQGDVHCEIIAAASIVAKVWRDRLMLRMAKKYPQYGFERHKGYGTRAHHAVIQNSGLCEIHRRSFSPMKEIPLVNS